MKISDELSLEQKLIIDSNEPKIIVSAGPGSGKTYTIIEKVVKELKKFELNSINKGVILCSFSKESSLELKKRLKKYIISDFSFIGTIDSFIFTNIINPFKNRILKKLKPESQLIKNGLKCKKPTFNKNDISNKLTLQGITDTNKDDILYCYKKWINNLIKGEYEISFPTYIFAGEAIEKVPELQNYLKTRYNSLYIDESQDLNFFQIDFIKKIINQININCYLIGDNKQSIYSFRGAKPEMIYSMINEGFKEMKITHSVRCHYNILEYSRRILDDNKERKLKLDNDDRVMINYSIFKNIDYLQKLNDYFILVESNKEAEKIYNDFLNKGFENIIYSKRIEIKNDISFSDNYYEIIEEIIKFYYNHANSTPHFTYSIEELSGYLHNIIDEKKLTIKNLSINKNESIVSYISKIFSLNKIQISEKILSEINEQMSQEMYKNQYLKRKGINRIMTIHSSKGLEAKFVFFKIQKKSFPINDEMKRKLFVGFTRAKEKLFIDFTENGEYPLKEYIQNIFYSTFK